MATLPLMEVLIFDDGTNTPESFAGGPWHHAGKDFQRLVCDLLLLTREVQGEGVAVNFEAIPSLIEEAACRMSRRIDEISAQLWVVDLPGVGMRWHGGETPLPRGRRPTPEEISDFEGDSRLAFDAMDGLEAHEARRLFAAWGVYCVELAIRRIKAGDAGLVLATLVATAGHMLGHANWCSAYAARSEKALEERRRGARKMREKNPKAQGDEAAKAAARKLWPDASRKGWTAARFHKELSDAGHAVPFDTSRKWLTKLRKTGTC